jgi:hypothetical protein
MQARGLTGRELRQRRKRARELNLAQYLKPGHSAGWTAGHLALLGIHPDGRVAALTGRSDNAVRVKRSKMDIPDPSGPGWTAESRP